MRKLTVLFLLLYSFSKGNAQIEVSKLVGKNSEDYSFGVGAFLKFDFPVSEAAAVTAEGGLRYFLEKEYGDTYGLAYVPLKVGYRYTLNGSGSGFYVEPQVGYNVYGVKSYQADGGLDVNERFNGFLWSAGTGYLFEAGRKGQSDISLRYESLLYKNGPASSIALRYSYNFSAGGRD